MEGEGEGRRKPLQFQMTGVMSTLWLHLRGYESFDSGAESRKIPGMGTYIALDHV